MATYDNTDGVWRTIGGRRVFIKDGQSLSDAMKESGKFKKKKDDEKEKLLKKYKETQGVSDDWYTEEARKLGISDEEIANAIYERKGAEAQSSSDYNIKRLIAKKEQEKWQTFVKKAEGQLNDPNASEELKRFAKDQIKGYNEKIEEFKNYEKKFEKELEFEKNVDAMYNRFHGKTDKEIAEEIAKERGERLLTDEEQRQREIDFMKKLEANQNQAQMEYEHAQDKFEHYKFNGADDEDRIKYKKLKDDAYDKYVKAQREYDETRLKKEYSYHKEPEDKEQEEELYQEFKEKGKVGQSYSEYKKELREKNQNANKEAQSYGGLNSKQDYEDQLKWYEDMEKKYPTKGGLKNNEEYQGIMKEYKSRFANDNYTSKDKEAAKRIVADELGIDKKDVSLLYKADGTVNIKDNIDYNKPSKSGSNAKDDDFEEVSKQLREIASKTGKSDYFSEAGQKWKEFDKQGKTSKDLGDGYSVDVGYGGRVSMRGTHSYDNTEYSYAEKDGDKWKVKNPANNTIKTYNTRNEALAEMKSIDDYIKTGKGTSSYEGIGLRNKPKQSYEEWKASKKSPVEKSVGALNTIDDIAGDDEKLQKLGRQMGSKSLSRWSNAYNEYKKKNPGTKLSLYQFIKINEK